MEYRPETYGEFAAADYDTEHPDPPAGAVAFLAARAKGGRALELGIGTGRFALPLSAAGVEVHGLDASPAMLAKLAAKPGGERIPVTLGDFGEVAVEGQFELIYVVFNTLFALTTQDAQVACCQRVAQHLAPGGAFVVEAFVPDLARLGRPSDVEVYGVETAAARLGIVSRDPLAQRLTAQLVRLDADGARLVPVQLRWIYPSELDLMARLAGLTLTERWGGWNGEPLGPRATTHVSVYTKAG